MSHLDIPRVSHGRSPVSKSKQLTQSRQGAKKTQSGSSCFPLCVWRALRLRVKPVCPVVNSSQSSKAHRHFSRFRVSGKLPPPCVHVPSMVARSPLILPSNAPPIFSSSSLSDEPLLVTEVTGIPKAPWSGLSIVAVRPSAVLVTLKNDFAARYDSTTLSQYCQPWRAAGTPKILVDKGIFCRVTS